MTTCARCGKTAQGFATIGLLRYCHGDQEQPTCYMQQNWDNAKQRLDDLANGTTPNGADVPSRARQAPRIKVTRNLIWGTYLAAMPELGIEGEGDTQGEAVIECVRAYLSRVEEDER